MKRTTFLTVLLLAANWGGTLVAQDRMTAVVDPSDGRFLYLNDRGAIVLAGPFDRAESFSGGLGRVSTAEGTAFLKPDGSVAFARSEPFEGLSGFSGGRAAFVRQDLLGFMDNTGAEVVAPQFAATTPWPAFDQGRAVVGTPVLSGWVKANGTLVTSPGRALPFVQGLSFVLIQDGWHLIDAEAKFVGTQAFTSAQPFSEGVAPVVLEGKAAWIDPQGKVALTVDAEAGGPFVGGYAVVQRGAFAGLVDRKGKDSLAADRYRALVPLHASTDAIKVWKAQENEDGPWTLVNEKGLAQSTASWQAIGSLSEGWVAFQLGGQWGYMDARGKTVLEPHWKAAGAFSSGLAAVQSETGWGLVDKKGKPVGPQNYQALGELQARKRAFLLNGQSGVVDEKGAVTTPVKDVAPAGYVNLGDAAAPFRVERPTRWGLIDEAGAWVIPAEHEALWVGEEGRVAVRGPWSGVLDARGAKVAAAPAGWVPAGPPQGARVPVRTLEAPFEGGLMAYDGSLVARGFLSLRGSLGPGGLCVQFANGRWGFVGDDGQPKFSLQWDDAQPFSEGLAAVAFEGQWGYIDVEGTKIIPYQYAAASGFRNGLAAVTVGDTPSYITTTGQRVWP